MVDVIAKAKITEVLYAQLSQDGDLYNEIMVLIRSEDSETAMVASAVTTLERPLKGPLRAVEVNADRLTPIRVRK